MPFIGLTGGLGTGKTSVLRIFRNSGAHTINADKIVHDIIKLPSVIKELSAALGNDILIKKKTRPVIDKKNMAAIIFSDPRKRKAAEKIIHSRVMETAQNEKMKTMSRNRRAVIIFEVPLLFEAGYGKLFDKVIVVHCNKSTAINRLKERGLSDNEARQRMQAQMPLAKKKSRADFLIDNNFDIGNTKLQVKSILEKLKNL